MKLSKIVIHTIQFLTFSTLISCTLDVSEPSHIINESWDQSMNTHPDSIIFQQAINNYTRKGLPGVVLYVNSPEGVWNGASGYASIENKVKMTPSHYHFSASVAKTYTATAVMLLVEEQLLELDQSIKTYLPKRIWSKLENTENITVRHLLNHRSGIPDFLDEIKYTLDILADPTQFNKAEDYLKYIYGKDVDFEADSRYEYSNSNYLLLALIMNNILGYSHTQYIREMILEKNGLENTYYEKGDGIQLPVETVNSYWDQDNNLSIVNVTDLQYINQTLAIGEDGILATSADFGRFFELLLTGQVVSLESLEEMLTMKGTTQEGFYGFGLFWTYGGGVGHDGGYIGTSTSVFYFPEKGTTICLLSNIGDVEGESKATALFEELLKRIVNLTVVNLSNNQRCSN